MPCGQMCTVLGPSSSMMLHSSYRVTEAAQENKISMFFLSTHSASLSVILVSSCTASLLVLG